jgi:hypothetical protein
MNTKILVIAFFAFVLLSCKKNAYNTKPTIKIKSISRNFVPIGENLTIQLEVTDKEGDVTDSLFMNKVRINQKKEPLTIRDTLYFKVPDAPNNTDGIVQLDLQYENHLKSAQNDVGQHDTLIFKFALQDKAKNKSDTISSEPIVIERKK